MHASALRWRGLVPPRQPVDVFARAVAGDFEFGPAQILELNGDRIAAVHGLEAFVIGSGCNDVSWI